MSLSSGVLSYLTLFGGLLEAISNDQCIVIWRAIPPVAVRRIHALFSFTLSLKMSHVMRCLHMIVTSRIVARVVKERRFVLSFFREI